MSLKIIGITGTLGAGKGVIVDYLIKRYNFEHYSVRNFLIQELEKRKLPVNRDFMVKIANELRTNNSPSWIIDQLYKQAVEKGKNSVIESIRTPSEVMSLKNNPNFILFAIDADPEIRYNRIRLRNSETDHVDFETFIQNEEREMHSTNPNEQNIAQCMEMADFLLINNDSLEELYIKIENILSRKLK